MDGRHGCFCRNTPRTEISVESEIARTIKLVRVQMISISSRVATQYLLCSLRDGVVFKEEVNGW